MTIAIYPGSFDPFTLGHLDIIKRLSPLYSKIIIVVSCSPKKKYLFSVEERIELITECVQDLKNIEVDSFYGLTVDYAKQQKASVILRGLRAFADFEYEMTMAMMNKKLNNNIETLIAFSSPEFNSLSSSMVKEVAFFGGSTKGLVSPCVDKLLTKKMLELKNETI